MREEYQYEEPDDWTQEELEMEAAAKKSQVGYLTLHTYTLNADPVPTGRYRYGTYLPTYLHRYFLGAQVP